MRQILQRVYTCIILYGVAVGIVAARTKPMVAALPQKTRQADSLARAQQAATADTQRIRLLNLTAIAYSELDLNRAMGYAREGLALAEKTQSILGQAQSLNITGYLYWLQGNMAEALRTLSRSLGAFEQVGGTPEGLSDVYNNLGMVYMAVDDLASAADNLQRALTMNEKRSNMRKLGTNYNNLATLYERSGENEKALGYYRKAYSTWQAVNDRGGEALALQNIGNWYFTNQNLPKAVAYLKQAQGLFAKLGQTQNLAGVYANLASVELAQRKNAAAVAHIDSARQIFRNFEDKLGLANCNLLQAQHSQSLGDFTQAVAAARQALQLCETAHYNEGIRNAAEMLADLTARTGDLRASLTYYKQYKAMNDSLNSVRNTRRVIAMEYKSELELTNLRVKRLQGERDLQLLVSVLLAALVLGVAAFGWIFFRYRRRLDAQEQLVNIARATPVPIAILETSSGRLLYANETFEEKLGYTSAQQKSLVANKLWVSERAYADMLTALQQAKGELHAYETALRHANGDQQWVLLSAEPIRYGNADALLTGIYDITDRKRDEEALTASKLAIESAYAELNATRSQLALSEKLALLGQLFAGIAHEINTPVGAADSSAQLALQALPVALEGAKNIFQQLPADQANALFAHLLTEAFVVKADSQTSSKTTKEFRALRRSWAETLEKMGIAQAEEVASTIINAGYEHPPEKLVAYLKADKSGTLPTSIAAIGRLFQGLVNISIASQKTRAIVLALKKYTHSSQATADDQDVKFSLLDNLNTILILYSYQIRKVAIAETNFTSTPYIIGNPDKLGQVWTNLIVNAVDAMTAPEGESWPAGILSIAVNSSEGFAEVTIADSGKGMPPEVAAKIFEPFFTTKPKGVGTGLGLHICKQIVEEFKGTMEVQSEPGRTAFIVRLPLAPR